MTASLYARPVERGHAGWGVPLTELPPARDRAVLMTVNDGRTRMLRATATLGAELLAR